MLLSVSSIFSGSAADKDAEVKLILSIGKISFIWVLWHYRSRRVSQDKFSAGFQ
jgi:hypothetical protein